MPKCVWTGASGQKYEYEFHPFGTTFSDEESANYVFSRLTTEGKHRPLYFGQTSHLKNRCCDTHHKWDAATEEGATHIHVHLSDDDETVRCAEESDLIARYSPKLNDKP